MNRKEPYMEILNGTKGARGCPLIDLWLLVTSCLISQSTTTASDKNNLTPNGLSKKGIYYWCDAVVPGSRGYLLSQCCHHTPFLSTYTLTLLNFILPHSQRLSLQRPAPTPLLTFKFQGEKTSGHFSRSPSNSLISPYWCYWITSSLWSENAMLCESEGRWSPNKSLELLAEEGRQITIVHFICESTGHQFLFFGIPSLSCLG